MITTFNSQKDNINLSMNNNENKSLKTIAIDQSQQKKFKTAEEFITKHRQLANEKLKQTLIMKHIIHTYNDSN